MDEDTQKQGKTMKRRGILAAAGAVVAGMLAKQTAQPVAATFALQGDFDNGGSGNTNIHSIGATPLWDINSADQVVFSVNNTSAASGVNNIGISVKAANLGIVSTVDFPNFNTAIEGNATASRGIGVSGSCNAPFGVGVEGVSSSFFGVQGVTDSGIAVIGKVQSGGVGTSNIGVLGVVGGDPKVPVSQPNTTGVYGQNFATGANGAGVLGQSDLASGVGVKGVSGAGIPVFGFVSGTGSGSNPNAGVLGAGTVGPGVQGQSTGGHGLVGTTSAMDGHAGLTGNASHAGGVGLQGVAPGYGTQSVGKAGDFYGNVKITGGALMAPVMQAVVPHAGDGTYRTLHTLASPESWFEDFGEGSLTNGTGVVTLDPDFASLIETTGYHVYLTEYDDHNNLFVTKRSATGFVVQVKETVNAVGIKAPTKAVSGTFGYRVVAKRKDIVGERLAKVAAPTTPKVPSAFMIPETSEVKPPPRIRSAL